MKRGLLIFTMLLLATTGLLVFSGMAAAEDISHSLSVTIPESLRLRLSATEMSFTTSDFPDYPPNDYSASNPYYSSSKQLTAYVHCNKNVSWQVKVYGIDFSSGSESMDISHLRWSTDGSSYSAMPEGNANAALVFGGGKTTGWQGQTIYYKIALDGSEEATTYSTTITYTLVTT